MHFPSVRRIVQSCPADPPRSIAKHLFGMDDPPAGIDRRVGQYEMFFAGTGW